MKKIIISLLVLFLMTSSGAIFAHERPHVNQESLTSSQRQADSLMQIEMAQHQQMEAVNAFPNYHPLIVHFPIVLLLMALIFQVLSFFSLKKEFGWTTFILLALGVIATWISSNTFHAMPGEISSKAKEIFDTHERMAKFTWWLGVAALLIKIVSMFILKRKLWAEISVALLLVGSAITVSIAGHHGAMLVHMEGIGPMGKYLEEYKIPGMNSDTTSTTIDMSGKTSHADTSNSNIATEHQANEKMNRPDTKKQNTPAADNMDENHHVGEPGKGPHGGTVEEAEPYHMEIVANKNNLIFYLLDGDAKPLDMKNVTGSVAIRYPDKSAKKFDLMEMDGKQTAMYANTKEPFTAQATLTRKGKSYSATFTSDIDLPKH